MADNNQLPRIEPYSAIQTDVTAAVTKTTGTTFGAVSSTVTTITGGDFIVETPGCILYSFVVSTVLIGCLCVFGVAGNTAAFIVFQKDKLKTSTSFLFQGIAVVDNLLLVTAFPIYCIEPFVAYTGLCEGYYQYARAIVLVHVLPLAFIAQTATVWSTVLIGVNRYIAVCHPYQAARLCSVRQARLQLSIVLGFAVLYNLPKFAEARVEFEYDSISTGEGTTTNMSLTGTDGYLVPTTSGALQVGLFPNYTWIGANTIYLLVYGNAMYTVFMLALPLLTLTVLNVRLIRALKAIGRKRAELQRRGGRPNCSRHQQAQDNNVTLVLIIVVLVFTICQAPALVTQFLWSVLPDSQRLCGGVQFYYSRLTNLLVIANSSVNFVVYLAFNTRFRQIIKQMYICGSIVGGLTSTDAVSCTVAPGGGNSGGECAPRNHKPTARSYLTASISTAVVTGDVVARQQCVAVESMSLLPYDGGTTHRAEEHNTTTNTADEFSEMQLLTSSNDEHCEQVAPLATTCDNDYVTDSLGRMARGRMQVVLVSYPDDDA